MVLSLTLTRTLLSCALVTSVWSPQFDTDSKFSDIDSELPATGNYTGGGETLTSVALTQTSDGSATITFDAADVSWANSTLSNVAAAVVYSSTAVSYTHLTLPTN